MAPKDLALCKDTARPAFCKFTIMIITSQRFFVQLLVLHLVAEGWPSGVYVRACVYLWVFGWLLRRCIRSLAFGQLLRERSAKNASKYFSTLAEGSCRSPDKANKMYNKTWAKVITTPGGSWLRDAEGVQGALSYHVLAVRDIDLQQQPLEIPQIPWGIINVR